MKKILILSLILSFTSAAFAQADTSNANQTVNGLPEGKWIQYFDYRNGAEVGSEDKSSPFYRVTMYKAGKRFGSVKEYYKTGDLWYEAFFNSDWSTVVQKDYYSNNKLILRDSILDDKGNHKIETYYGNGKLDSKFVITINVLGDCKVDVQNPDGDLGVELIGVISGEIQQYDETSGYIKMAWLYSYDQNKGEKFTLDGYDKLWTLLVKNIKSRVVKEYSDKGIIKTETPYSDGIVYGVIKGYYEDGTIKSEATWSHKRLNGVSRAYDKNGKLAIETPYVDGAITGVVKHYYPNGKIESETQVYENRQVGDPTLYDVDGNKVK
jgi:antitoxin component YwqK of YwqJK toxin-antitoxin module